MIRCVIFSMIVWFVVTFCSLIFQHLTTSDKVSVIKAIRYGLFTAIISSVIVAGIVVLF